jgi:hypothetical protein
MTALDGALKQFVGGLIEALTLVTDDDHNNRRGEMTKLDNMER